MQPTTDPELTLGCTTCDLVLVLPVPEGFDIRPVMGHFFSEHAACSTYIDLGRAAPVVSQALLVPRQRSPEVLERR